MNDKAWLDFTGISLAARKYIPFGTYLTLPIRIEILKNEVYDGSLAVRYSCPVYPERGNLAAVGYCPLPQNV